MCYKKRHWDCVGQYRSVVVNSAGELMFCSWDDSAPRCRTGAGACSTRTIDDFSRRTSRTRGVSLAEPWEGMSTGRKPTPDPLFVTDTAGWGAGAAVGD